MHLPYIMNRESGVLETCITPKPFVSKTLKHFFKKLVRIFNNKGKYLEGLLPPDSITSAKTSTVVLGNDSKIIEPSKDL
mgnify:CR=1 FL=1